MKTKLLLSVGIFVLSACGSEPSPFSTESTNTANAAVIPEKPSEPKPLPIEWKSDSIQTSFTSGELQGEVYGLGTEYTITLSNFPPGSEYEIGEQKGTVESNVYHLSKVDVRNKLGGYTVEELEKFDPELTLKLKLPDGRQGETKLPPVSFKYSIKDILKKAENSPVLFGEEPEDPKPEDSLYWVDGLIGKEFIGKAGKLNEIDFVAIMIKLSDDKGSKVCTGYKDNSGKAMPDITLLFRETEVTIYNRRTGDVVEQKVFPPNTNCPTLVFKAEGENTEESSHPYAQIESWLRTMIKR